MAVAVFTPQTQILLIKVVRRTGTGVAARYAAAPRQVDITWALGDAGVLRTSKALDRPDGQFSITFADAIDPNTRDSIEALVEPGDAVEIRAARRPEMYAGGPLPLVMRGFVARVERRETVDGDGNPIRTVTISGGDSGRLLVNDSLYFALSMLPASQGGTAEYLAGYDLNAVTGMQPRLYSANEYMRTLVDVAVNPRIQMLNIISNNTFKPFKVEASVPDGSVYPQQGQNIDAITLWEAAAMFMDRPWNEGWVRDDESGPVLVFRPAPFRDLNGRYIMNGAVDPGTVKIDIAAVVDLHLMRSDARVGNFWFVPPGNSSLLSNGMVSLAAVLTGEAMETGHANNDGWIFGVRRMSAPSNLLPTSLTDIPSMLPPNERDAAVGAMTEWNVNRATLLKLMNHDNAVLTEGTATVQGNENLQIGKYLQLTRGSLTSEYYIQRVAHSYQPLKTWLTDLVLIRGTDFLSRINYTGSPAAAEGRGGPYIPTTR